MEPDTDGIPIGDHYNVHASTVLYYAGPPGEVVVAHQVRVEDSLPTLAERLPDAEFAQTIADAAESYNLSMPDYCEAAVPSHMGGTYGDTYQLWETNEAARVSMPSQHTAPAVL